ncbi:MAG: hypothetical protein IPK67_02455 [Planctomycetes bacterium]|nr:hypothetical protein [Planctomycetota bacterium]
MVVSTPRLRAQPELLVEPPRAGLEALLVLVAQLVGVDRERVRAEDRAHHGECPRIHVGRLGAAIGVEHVVGHFRRAHQRAAQHVADGHAVLERQEGIDALQQEPPLGLHADAGELQVVAAIHQPHVAGVAVHERVQVAGAGDHRFARQGDERLPLAARELLDPERRHVHLAPQVRTRPRQRGDLKAGGGHGVARQGARGTAVPPGEPHGHVQLLRESIAHQGIPQHGVHAPHQELGVAFPRRLEPPDPGPRGELQFIQGRRLAPEREQGQALDQELVLVEPLPVDR